LKGDNNILQGDVAMLLRCDGIFNNHFIADLLLRVQVKEVSRLVYIWCIYDKNLVWWYLTFLDHSVDVPVGLHVHVDV